MMPETNHERRGPVFMLCPPRSYSTIATALLSGHPEIYAFPELLLFSAKTVGELLVKGSRRRDDNEPPTQGQFRAVRLTGLLRTVAQLHEGSQEDAPILRAIDWLSERSDWSMTRLFDYLLTLVHPRIGLEKSPTTILADANLRRCLDAYPQAKYIHLTRHPVSAQKSMQAHTALIHPQSSPRQTVVTAATTWYLGHRRATQALAAIPRQQWLRIQAEQLLSEPRTWLPYILDWLEISYDSTIIEAMLRTDRWDFAGTGPSGRLFGGDYKFMADPALRPVDKATAQGFDPDWGLLDEMKKRMTALATELGYEVAEDSR